MLGGGHLPTASPALPEPDSRRPYGGVITAQQTLMENAQIMNNEKPDKPNPNDLPNRY